MTGENLEGEIVKSFISDENKRKIKSAVKKTALLFGVPLAINAYFFHNVEYTGPYIQGSRRMDGPYSHTIVEKYEKGHLTVSRFDLFFKGLRRYTDSDRDGMVDTVEIVLQPLISRGGVSGDYYRHRHFETRKDIFEAADKDYNEQLKRFGID